MTLSGLITEVAGSFRDPSGRVLTLDNRIIRSVSESGQSKFVEVASTGLFDDYIRQGRLVAYSDISEQAQSLGIEAPLVLEHPKLAYISYPYEWPFTLLKRAALFHLKLQQDALAKNVSLSDATAYNVQFSGCNPIFIDHLSFVPYKEGDYWLAHRQFCEQFLTPLLLRAVFDIPHNDWMKGCPDGIPMDQLSQILPWHKKLSLRMLTHITLPVYFERRERGRRQKSDKRSILKRPLPRASYLGLLKQLEKWIQSLQPPRAARTVWETYAQENNYATVEADQKKGFVATFVDSVKPRLLVDLGCNSGDYSEISLQHGAEMVVGFDVDQHALDKACERGVDKQLAFLPLYFNAVNPSPNLGWRQQERTGFAERTRADAVLALAFLHHLCIAKNIPLEQAIEWIVSIAPVGVIEFVPKTDRTIEVMLEHREDIFSSYSKENFETHLSSVARIHQSRSITAEGRTLYWYVRQ